MRVLDTTPKQDGFYMPAEFSEHYGCILIFPERSDSAERESHRLRQRQAVRERPQNAPAAYPCGGDVQQRQLGEGLRPDFCNKRSDYTRSKLEFQRLGRS